MPSRISVLLCTQGTYPFSSGGVSTWCDLLCRQLPNVDFTLYALTGQPQTVPLYTLPENVRRSIAVPMWGMQHPAEYVATHLTFLQIRERERMTTPEIIETMFIPNLRTIVRGILAPNPSIRQVSQALYDVWKFTQVYDWNASWKAESTWNAFTHEVQSIVLRFPEMYPNSEAPTLHDLNAMLRMLYHLLMCLNAPLPRTDIVHSTLSGFAGIAGILAKFEYGTPLVVTEHGIFVREQYMHISQEKAYSPFAKRFLIQFSNLVCKLVYAAADVISPVCDYNKRWETRFGADEAKIERIYNSVDTEFFRPHPKPPETERVPTVVAATRVFPLKDLETMIRAAAVVRDRIPSVRFIVFGATTDEPEYFARCQALVEKLRLTRNFTFAGLCERSHRIYTTGDISVISSVSEAFPFAVIESMACGRPVVATDVGGIREVLEGGTEPLGVIVPPRNPEALGAGIIQLLTDERLRKHLGEKAREEVVKKYHKEFFTNAYLQVYRRLLD
jgi:polysaccharide biosynthesis protein PelF